MSVDSNFKWLHRQGIQISDKLSKEGWTWESKMVHLLSEQYLRMCQLSKDAGQLLQEIQERVDDPEGMTPDEKEEVRRDHVEGDNE